uniref:Uncharacterized protein n=1 Tax=Rhizophora mucronata TaxID=61149 RepID=A0A2P2N1U9_RHIMU
MLPMTQLIGRVLPIVIRIGTGNQSAVK